MNTELWDEMLAILAKLKQTELTDTEKAAVATCTAAIGDVVIEQEEAR